MLRRKRAPVSDHVSPESTEAIAQLTWMQRTLWGWLVGWGFKLWYDLCGDPAAIHWRLHVAWAAVTAVGFLLVRGRLAEERPEPRTVVPDRVTRAYETSVTPRRGLQPNPRLQPPSAIAAW